MSHRLQLVIVSLLLLAMIGGSGWYLWTLFDPGTTDSGAQSFNLNLQTLNSNVSLANTNLQVVTNSAARLRYTSETSVGPDATMRVSFEYPTIWGIEYRGSPAVLSLFPTGTATGERLAASQVLITFVERGQTKNDPAGDRPEWFFADHTRVIRETDERIYWIDINPEVSAADQAIIIDTFQSW